jgi:hypothetical protein
VDKVLGNVCPNCGGGFVPRPIRPAREWRPGVSLQQHPLSAKRRAIKYSREEVAAFSAKVRGVPAGER